MKVRRHHNNKGYRQVKYGKPVKQVESMKHRLLKDANKK